jgi:hypothetical protein
MKNTTSNHAPQKTPLKTVWAINGAHGFVAAPFVLIRNKGVLRLDDDELALVLAIMTHKWSEQAPWPSVETLADYLGWSGRKVQRTLCKLKGTTQARGPYVVVTPRKTGPKSNASNLYDLTPLFIALAKLEAVADKNGVAPRMDGERSRAAPNQAAEVGESRTGTGPATSPTPVEEPPVQPPPGAAERASQEAREPEPRPAPTASPVPGFGRPRYDLGNEAADEYEATHAEELARGDAQAEEDERQAWLRDFADAALTQYEAWNLPGWLSWLEAQTPENIAAERYEFFEYLVWEGPTLAAMGIDPYPDLVAHYLPEVWADLQANAQRVAAKYPSANRVADESSAPVPEAKAEESKHETPAETAPDVSTKAGGPSVAYVVRKAAMDASGMLSDLFDRLMSVDQVLAWMDAEGITSKARDLVTTWKGTKDDLGYEVYFLVCERVDAVKAEQARKQEEASASFKARQDAKASTNAAA